MFSIIKKALDQRSPVYVLSGDEDFLIRQFISSLKELIPPTERQFNLVVLTAGDKSGQEAVYQARTLPMFGKQKVVIVYSAHQWKEKDWQAILIYAANPVKHSILTIEASKKSKSLSKFEKDLLKLGVLLKFNRSTNDKDFLALLKDYCQNRGIDIEADGLAVLSELSDRALEPAINEIEKLILTYPDKKRFTKDDILYVIGIDKNYNIFELINAISSRNPALIARIGRNLATQRNTNIFEIILMLHKIIMYADLGRQYYTSRKSNLEKNISAALKCSYWSARQAAVIIRNYTEEEINHILGVLYIFNKKAVGIESGFSTPQELIEDLAIELATVAKAKPTKIKQ